MKRIFYKTFAFILVLSLIFSIYPISSNLRAKEIKPRSILEKIEKGIVKIQFESEGEAKIGAGSVISEEGHILTARHLLEDQYGTFVKDFSVFDDDGEKYRGFPVTTSKEEDLAVIKIKNANLPPIPRGSSGNLEILDYVMTVGYPYGSFTVTEGKISGLPDRPGLPSLQFTAPVASGSSGGPLVDRDGNLIGIVLGRVSEKSGFGFALPIDQIEKYLPPYKDRLSFPANTITFGRDGTMYFLSRPGNLESWRPGGEDTKTLKEDLKDPSDVAVYERYVYYASKGEGGAIKSYSTFEGEITTVIEEPENPGDLALGSNGDLYFTHNDQSPGNIGSISAWRYKTGEIEKLLDTDCTIGGIGVDQSEDEDLLYAGCKTKNPDKKTLYEIDLSTGEAEKKDFDLPSNLDLGVNEEGRIFYLGEGDPVKVYVFDPDEPETMTKLTEGPYLSGAWDEVGNLYLSGEDGISIFREN